MYGIWFPLKSSKMWPLMDLPSAIPIQLNVNTFVLSGDRRERPPTLRSAALEFFVEATTVRIHNSFAYLLVQSVARLTDTHMH